MEDAAYEKCKQMDLRRSRVRGTSVLGSGVRVERTVRALSLIHIFHSDPRLLVGFDKSDDASVYQVTDELALVQTVDFFPPIADDPYLFGQIAATNALSDVYAMGGEPVSYTHLG